VFENRALRILGPRRDAIRGEWRKVHSEKLNDLYSLPSIVQVIKSRRMSWAGHVTRMEERFTQGFGWKPEGKRPLGRSRRRWEDDIKMYLQELGCEGMDWIDLVQDTDRWRAFVNAVMNHWVS
jgi:hypothetical protein